MKKNKYKGVSGVYSIRNSLNGKSYVGSSIDLGARFMDHKARLRHNRHYSKDLQADWNLEGEEFFEFVVLEFCNVDMLVLREDSWISYLKTLDPRFGYNRRDSSTMSDQAREQCRIAQSLIPHRVRHSLHTRAWGVKKGPNPEHSRKLKEFYRKKKLATG